MAVGLAGLTTVLALCRLAILAASDRLWTSEAVVAGFPFIDIGAVAGAVVGAVIITRHPRHRIGWLFVVGQLLTEIGVVAQAYGVGALRGDLPGATYAPGAVAVGLHLGAFPTLGLLALLFLLAPAGEWPRGRWRWGIAIIVIGLVLHTAGLTMIRTDRVNASGQVAGPDSVVVQLLLVAAYLLVAAGVVVGAASLFSRLRHSDGRAREQLTWITLAAVVLAAAAVFTLISVEWLDLPPWLSLLPVMVAYAAVPVLTGIGVLRHRLFDVDVVLNRAVVLGILSGSATLLYVTVVTVVSGPAPSSMRDLGLVPSMAITAAVALLLQPARAWASGVASRLVYGAQAAPYVALADFTRELQDVPHPHDMLSGVAQAIGRTVGASTVRLDIRSAGHADWPTETITWSDARGNQGARAPHWTGPVLAERGLVVGEVSVTMPPDRRLRALDRQLLADFTTQVGHAISNVRLGAELSARARELTESTQKLEASRRRLVKATDEERVRFEAAIRHVVLPHLEPMPAALREMAESLRTTATDGSAAVPAIEDLIERAHQAVEALRTVTRGVFPAQLARRGVAAALHAHLRSARPRAEVTVRDWWTERRLEPRRESTLYFAVVDLVGTMSSVRSVDLTADRTADVAVVVVTGSTERVPASRLRLLADRLAAFDGSVRPIRASSADPTERDGFVVRMPVRSSGESLQREPSGAETVGIE